MLSDEIIEFKSPASKQKYPLKTTSVVEWDEKNNQAIALLTNKMNWPSATIANLFIKADGK